MTAPYLSIVVPTLDEAGGIERHLGALRPLRAAGCEIVVVDGGSRDGTPDLARPLADVVIEAPRGRGSQLAEGARRARGEVLLFLHADTRLPPDALPAIREALDGGRREWGRFDVAIEGRSRMLPVIASLVNWRSRWSGIATGDQAVFVRREAYDAVGGFPAIPLMEDVALARSLRRRSRPACLAQRVETSGRRWESKGVLRTVLLMWWLRFLYWAGRDPAALSRRYG